MEQEQLLKNLVIKMFNLFGGIIFILFSIVIYSSGIISSYRASYIELGLLKYPFSFFTFLYGVWLIANYKKIKLDEEEIYTICPNCKETFTYNELENGKCPYCEDVDTIDIEEYYKK